MNPERRLETWDNLLAEARQEVESVLAELPSALQARARGLPVTYRTQPDRHLRRTGIAWDTLGLFVGEALDETSSTGSPLPAQIILFLENLRDMAEGDPETYREEVRTTFLHELGHYLGLDEIDLCDRGLD
jgi:predicted Zn-dependent protease with MMP-like domain